MKCKVYFLNPKESLKTPFLFASAKKRITYLSYCRVVIKVNAQKFFRIEVNTSWGHLIKERKTLTKPEETVKEAKRAYRDGIKKAWEVYTQDNIMVQEAKKTLDSAIDEAYKSCLPEHGEGMPKTEYKQANRLYIQTLYEIHSKFADTIGQIWVVFMEDMETTSWLTKKNT
jgi:hypothetical protein